ncbi:MAG: hypothetical protein ACK4ZJ_17910, partial [Allorhizobium sp.]
MLGLPASSAEGAAFRSAHPAQAAQAHMHAQAHPQDVELVPSAGARSLMATQRSARPLGGEQRRPELAPRALSPLSRRAAPAVLGGGAWDSNMLAALT